VQGDEPFIDTSALKKLIDVYKNDTDNSIDLASLAFEITEEDEINNPNNVKVVVDQNNYALYFSRSVIPYPREKNVGVRYLQHIGIYAFRKQALLDFYNLPMQSLEASEKLEQLRYLEFGKRIKIVEVSEKSIGIDTPEDLEKARSWFLKK
jgi:3-deoxy-manno-octulosonate cytidylyltransferase (CMP-KDO synthetase)